MYQGQKAKHPLYDRWKEMKRRCEAKNHKNYSAYGAKGIKVSKRWQDFYAFLEDMGPPPSPKHSVDRIDNSKGYSKENCRWATHIEQMRNRAKKTHCKNGHPKTENSFVLESNGRQMVKRCIECTKIREQKKRNNRKKK